MDCQDVDPVAVLRLLDGGENYGYELVAALDRQTDDVLVMSQSKLYPLLYNLEAKGLIAGVHGRILRPR